MAASGAEGGTGGGGGFIWVLLIVVVGMMFLTMIPQKKRQKQQQSMLQSIATGTRIKTIGGLIGKVVETLPDNTLIINVGTEDAPTLIRIDRMGIYQNIDAMDAMMKQREAEKAAKASKKGKKSDPNVNDVVIPKEEDKKIDE